MPGRENRMTGDIVFDSMRFRPARKSISYLMNRYHVGKMLGGDLHVSAHELAFLASKEKILLDEGEFKLISTILSGIPYFFQTFAAYFYAKSHGLIASVQGTTMIVRRNARSKPVTIYITGDMGELHTDFIIEPGNSLHAVIDMDGDMTLFEVSSFNPEGKFIFGKYMDSSERMQYGHGGSLQDQGYSKGAIRFLPDEENGMAGESERSMQRIHLYGDLKGRGILPKSGFKYGADFRGYTGPESTHAEYLISSLHENESWSEISRLVRVSNGVRKTCVFCLMKYGKIHYIKIRWIKDFAEIIDDQI